MRWAAWLLLALAACAAGPRRYRAWTYEPPPAADRWTTAPAADHGVDEAPLEQMVQALASERFVGVHSVVLVHHGQLILEAHDRANRADKPHDLRSATKSITALLTGIAIDQGQLDRTTPLPSAVANPARPDMTVEDLLLMRPGLACDDRDRRSPGFEERMYRRRDWLAFWRELPPAPFKGSRYCTAGVVALGGAIAVGTGQDVPAFADQHLFGPLGINNAQWQTFSGGTDTGGHLRLTARDLAKVGQLILNRGEWEGKRLVSAEWIEAMTTPQTTVDDQPYGYLVWLGSYGGLSNDAHPLWQFRGNGGQYVFILPDHQLVAAFTGGAYNRPEAGLPFHLMGRFVLPALGVVGGGRAEPGAAVTE